MTFGEEYTTTCDFKQTAPLTDEERKQIVDYFKSRGLEIKPDEIIEPQFIQVSGKSVPIEVIEKQIYRLFKKLELSPACAGYEYTVLAVIDSLRSTSRRVPVGRLYKSIGETYGKPYTCVERSIRHIKERMIKTESTVVKKTIEDVFGSGSERKFTNGDFISGLVLYIKYEIGIA